MKRVTMNRIAIGLILTVIIVITSFSFRAEKSKVNIDLTQYYWFDASGNYLWRQNTISNEINLTGLDEFNYSPYTLQEKGYAPALVSGNPPVPVDPSNPSRRLYSHP